VAPSGSGPCSPSSRTQWTSPSWRPTRKARRGIGKELDRLVYDEALNVFLCCPQALVAVDKHVDFTGHAARELAETEVGEGHWSRRDGG
jgi:hypothetical protein